MGLYYKDGCHEMYDGQDSPDEAAEYRRRAFDCRVPCIYVKMTAFRRTIDYLIVRRL